MEFLRKFGAVRIRVRLGGARFVFLWVAVRYSVIFGSSAFFVQICGFVGFSAVQPTFSFSVGYTFTFG